MWISTPDAETSQAKTCHVCSVHWFQAEGFFPQYNQKTNSEKNQNIKTAPGVIPEHVGVQAVMRSAFNFY